MFVYIEAVLFQLRKMALGIWLFTVQVVAELWVALDQVLAKLVDFQPNIGKTDILVKKTYCIAYR